MVDAVNIIVYSLAVDSCEGMMFVPELNGSSLIIEFQLLCVNH